MGRYAVDHHIIKTTNQHLILNKIQKDGPVTCAMLSRELHLSPPSVSANVKQLTAKGILVNLGTEGSDNDKLGRRGILVDINRNYSYWIGVDLSGRLLKIGLGDLSGEALFYEESVEIVGKDTAYILNKVQENIDMVLAAAAISLEQLSVIVVSSPGIYDEKTASISIAPQFKGWENVSFDMLKDRYKAEVIVKNDINLFALGEAYYGYGTAFKDFVFISIDLGIGAGIVVNRQLFEGTAMAAGEIGYMMTSLGQFGAPIEQGALEKILCVPAIIGRMAECSGMAIGDISQINRLYREGNKAVLAQADQIAKELAMVVVNINALINVPLICFGGEILKLEIGLLDRIRLYANPMLPVPCKTAYSKLGNRGFLKGAYSLALNYIFEKCIVNG